MDDKYWFKSSAFELQGAEDELTNPGRFGKSLAEWLSMELEKLNYKVEVVPEDWGWCVVCERSDYLLWVGCGNIVTEEILDSTIENPPNIENITWHVFSEIEVPFFNLKSHFKKLTGKLDISSPKAKLDKALNQIITTSGKLELCAEPQV